MEYIINSMRSDNAMPSVNTQAQRTIIYKTPEKPRTTSRNNSPGKKPRYVFTNLPADIPVLSFFWFLKQATQKWGSAWFFLEFFTPYPLTTPPYNNIDDLI